MFSVNKKIANNKRLAGFKSTQRLESADRVDVNGNNKLDNSIDVVTNSPKNQSAYTSQNTSKDSLCKRKPKLKNVNETVVQSKAITRSSKSLDVSVVRETTLNDYGRIKISRPRRMDDPPTSVDMDTSDITEKTYNSNSLYGTEISTSMLSDSNNITLSTNEKHISTQNTVERKSLSTTSRCDRKYGLRSTIKRPKFADVSQNIKHPENQSIAVEEERTLNEKQSNSKTRKDVSGIPKLVQNTNTSKLSTSMSQSCNKMNKPITLGEDSFKRDNFSDKASTKITYRFKLQNDLKNDHKVRSVLKRERCNGTKSGNDAFKSKSNVKTNVDNNKSNNNGLKVTSKEMKNLDSNSSPTCKASIKAPPMKNTTKTVTYSGASKAEIPYEHKSKITFRKNIVIKDALQNTTLRKAGSKMVFKSNELQSSNDKSHKVRSEKNTTVTSDLCDSTPVLKITNAADDHPAVSALSNNAAASRFSNVNSEREKIVGTVSADTKSVASLTDLHTRKENVNFSKKSHLSPKNRCFNKYYQKTNLLKQDTIETPQNATVSRNSTEVTKEKKSNEKSATSRVKNKISAANEVSIQKPLESKRVNVQKNRIREEYRGKTHKSFIPSPIAKNRVSTLEYINLPEKIKIIKTPVSDNTKQSLICVKYNDQTDIMSFENGSKSELCSKEQSIMYHNTSEVEECKIYAESDVAKRAGNLDSYIHEIDKCDHHINTVILTENLDNKNSDAVFEANCIKHKCNSLHIKHDHDNRSKKCDNKSNIIFLSEKINTKTHLQHNRKAFSRVYCKCRRSRKEKLNFKRRLKSILRSRNPSSIDFHLFMSNECLRLQPTAFIARQNSIYSSNFNLIDNSLVNGNTRNQSHYTDTHNSVDFHKSSTFLTTTENLPNNIEYPVIYVNKKVNSYTINNKLGSDSVP